MQADGSFHSELGHHDMSQEHLTAVWNRAALEGGGPGALAGDRALASLLLVHGMVMNGGVWHATEVLSAGELAAGLDGYRFFGFTELAEILVGVENASDQAFDKLDELYWHYIPADDTIGAAFEEKFAAHPELFARL